MFSYIEALFVTVSLLILFGYQIWHLLQVKRMPLATSTGFNNHARATWVKHVQDEQRDILAVQTLRNQVMAATFLASTATLISLGLLSAAFRPGLFSDIS